MAQIIPLDSSPNQTFQCVISIDGVNRTFLFNIRYNEIAGYWTMKVTDAETDELLLDSIPLLTGDEPAHNMLEPYIYMNIGAAYLANIGNVSENPSATDLGENFLLIWGNTPS